MEQQETARATKSAMGVLCRCHRTEDGRQDGASEANTGLEANQELWESCAGAGTEDRRQGTRRRP